MPVTFEEYAQVFRLLGMRLQALDSHLLPFLRQKWRADFGLSDEEMTELRSTGILVAARAEGEVAISGRPECITVVEAAGGT